MKLTNRILAIGAVAMLLIGGLALVALTPSASAEDATPVVSVDDQAITSTNHSLAIQVMNKVKGQMAPLSGVNVTVCRMNITNDGNTTTMVIENVTTGVTDDNGNVTFTLPEGKYFVFAENNGLRGFSHVNLSEDQAYQMKMHHWNWGHMKGEKFQYMAQECDRNGAMGQNGTGNCSQTRGMSQDRSQSMDRNMDQTKLQKKSGTC